MVALLAWPSISAAKTEARCGLATGFEGGLSIPTDMELKDEFRYLYHVEADVKYYLLYLFSISGSIGYEYGMGAPKAFFHEGEVMNLDGRGLSFIRAVPLWMTFRVEPFRRYKFNPYLGASAGTKYMTIERMGYERQIRISDSGKEWLFGWMGQVGFDYLFTDYFFGRMEVRYSSLPSRTEKFFLHKDYGMYDAFIGFNIYF